MGRVRSIDRVVNSRNGGRRVKGKILRYWIDKDGYRRVTLYYSQKKKHYGIHRLVALSFIPNLENKPQVNHIDGDKEDNKIDNLEWVTNSENQQHAVYTGLREGVKGEDNHNSILTEENVREIYRLYSTDKHSMEELSSRFNISVTNIYNIVSRNMWKHIDLGEHLVRDVQKSYIYNDKDIVNRVIKMYKKGLSLRKISTELDVSRTTVVKILESNSIKIKSNYTMLSSSERKEIARLYDTRKYTKAKLAEMFNVSRPTVRKILK